MSLRVLVALAGLVAAMLIPAPAHAVGQMVGNVDIVSSPAPGKVHVAGWVFDDDSPQTTLTVHVYVGSEGFNLGPTMVKRPDVNAAFGGNIGDYHGFDSTLEVNATGPQTVSFYTFNVAGTPGNNPVLFAQRTVTVQADVTAPVTSITSGPVGAAPPGPVSYTFTANEPATFECSWDGAPMSPCTSPATADLAIGPHDFHVRATDRRGNVESPPVGRGFEILPPGVSRISAVVKAVKKRTRLLVDLGPDSANLDYKFVVQRRADGRWKRVKKARTKGARDRRVLDLKRGVYRVKVPAQLGLEGTRSGRVRLRR